jgi:SSS family solute:Na+ symporter
VNIALSTADLAIIAIYFLAVLAIGFYLKGFAKSGEDFFLGGREMTAWVAGLSFLSANLGPGRRISTASSRCTGIGSARFPRCCSWAS